MQNADGHGICRQRKKKNEKKIWRFEKRSYLCTRFRQGTAPEREAAREARER